MRTIDDLSHFVLAEGETLILRFNRSLTNEQLATARARIAETLPGRPVLVLPPDIDVCAGIIEVFGAEPDPKQVDWDQMEADKRAEIEKAYDDGRMVYCKEAAEGTHWFFIHKEANPITGWAWDLYLYRLTKPKPGE